MVGTVFELEVEILRRLKMTQFRTLTLTQNDAVARSYSGPK